MIYSSKKGLTLYYYLPFLHFEEIKASKTLSWYIPTKKKLIFQDKGYLYGIAIHYISVSFSFFEILTNYATYTNISFYDYVVGGINSYEAYFTITEIDPEITLFKNNEIIKSEILNIILVKNLLLFLLIQIIQIFF